MGFFFSFRPPFVTVQKIVFQAKMYYHDYDLIYVTACCVLRKQECGEHGQISYFNCLFFVLN